MSSVSRSPITLGEFTDRARQASRSQGYLNVNRKGGLVVQGTGWVGRRVLWVKMHFFPKKVREQNMKVLNVLRESYRLSLHKEIEEGDLKVSTADPRHFTRDLFELAQGKREEWNRVLLSKHAPGAAYNFFHQACGGSIKGRSMEEVTLLDFVESMRGLDRQMLGSRFTLFVNKLVRDKNFAGGQIQGGTQKYQSGRGELDNRFLRAAFFVNLEKAYREHREVDRGVREKPFSTHYSLANSREIEWMRGVSAAAGLD